MKMMRRILMVSAMMAILGCEEYDGAVIANLEEARLDGVTGGSDVDVSDQDYIDLNRAVVGLGQDSLNVSYGSGLIIAPRLVLTVEHNGLDREEAPDGAPRSIRIGDDSGNPLEQVPVDKEIDHSSADIGLWVLKRPATMALPYWRPSSNLGNDMSLWGFGYEPPTDHLEGTLNTTTLDYDANIGLVNTANYGWSFWATGDGGSQGEKRDSGGPIFNSNMEQVGVHSGSPGNWGTRAVSVAKYQTWIQNIIDEYQVTLRVGDFDGDGVGDLFFWNKNNKGNWNDVSSGGYPDGIAEKDPTAWCKKDLLLGDFNGNGRIDLLCYNTTNDRMYIDYASTNGTFHGTNEIVEMDWCNGDLFTGDFNGDGLDDLYCRETANDWRRVALNNGQSSRFTGSTWQINSGWCQKEIYVGDYNGDGRDDILCRNPEYRMYVKFATAAGDFSAPHVWSDSNWCQKTLRVDDFNGDGVDDLLCWNNDDSNLSIDFGSKSSTFPFSGTNWSDYNFHWCNREMQTGDMNDDGQADLVCYNPDSGKVSIDFYTTTSKFNGVSNLRIPNVDSPVWP